MQNSPRVSLSARGYHQPRARQRGSTQGSCRGLPWGAGGDLGSCHSGQWPSVCAACIFSVGRGGGNSRALEKCDCQHAAAQGAAGTRALPGTQLERAALGRWEKAIRSANRTGSENTIFLTLFFSYSSFLFVCAAWWHVPFWSTGCIGLFSI